MIRKSGKGAKGPVHRRMDQNVRPTFGYARHEKLGLGHKKYAFVGDESMATTERDAWLNGDASV